MIEAPDAANLENAIRQYVLQATEIAREGEVHIRIDLAQSSPATGQLRGVLFLSTGWPVGDSTWLTNLMACVRDGFERDLLDAPFRATVERDQPFETFRDGELGKVFIHPARVSDTRTARVISAGS